MRNFLKCKTVVSFRGKENVGTGVGNWVRPSFSMVRLPLPLRTMRECRVVSCFVVKLFVEIDIANIIGDF